MVDLIKEGRAALVTTIGMFKFMACYRHSFQKQILREFRFCQINIDFRQLNLKYDSAYNYPYTLLASFKSGRQYVAMA